MKIKTVVTRYRKLVERGLLMKAMASYYTDAGNVKSINQDSLLVKIVSSPYGRIVFAVLCDGMGGLEQGELASKEAVLAFDKWFQKDFVRMLVIGVVTENEIYYEWEKQIDLVNQRLHVHTSRSGEMLGTTLTVLLIYKSRYYICHVGDSRIYKVDKELQIMTIDHTLVAHELQMGILEPEQVKDDPRKNVLLQCVGASIAIEPQLTSGEIAEDVSFILCSDGFVHKISQNEMYNRFRPERLNNKNDITNACELLSKLAMKRGERDNITAIGIVLKMQ